MKKLNIDHEGRISIGPSTVVAGSQSPVATPSIATSGMTMAQLLNNYRAILRARAIYYPVAFQFVRVLGRGRQGVVFLALRQGSRGCITEHAIKVFTPELYRNPEEYWTDMGRMASQISKLDHVQSPHLVSRYSYEETYGIGYAQLEAIDGMDLRRFLSRKQLDLAKERCTRSEWQRFTERIFALEGDKIALQPGAAVYIMRRVLRGIEHLHSANFLHSDIKPANIMIDRLGSVKVVDFGRAVMVGERVSFLLGTPMYMAPEVHRREPGGIQSDFYSVGLVGLELLRGEPLSPDPDTEEDKLLQIKMTIPDNITKLLPKHLRTRRTFVRVMRRLLEPDPVNRHGSAEEAEVGEVGLVVLDKQFAKEGEDAEYRREFSDYLAKLIDPKTQRIETEEESGERQEPTEVLT